MVLREFEGIDTSCTDAMHIEAALLELRFSVERHGNKLFI